MAWRGQLSVALREVRVHLCQTSNSSAPAREFILKNYKDLKTLNPCLPILVREAHGIQPRLWARYCKGVEKSVSIEGLTEPQILAKLEELVKYGMQANKEIN